MRTLLISANTEQLQMPVLPLGLACVAEAAARAGHEARVVNLMTTDDLEGRDLEGAIRDFDPEVIGISVRNIDDQSRKAPKFLLKAVKNVVDGCRALTSAPIVLGGAGYSIYPRSALAFLGADMGIRGEGEGAFVKLLDKMSGKSGKEELSDIPGLYLPGFAGGGVKTGDLKRLDDFALPVPGALFPTQSGEEKVWLPFQTRRGCPMRCSYCSTAAIEGSILRKRSPEIAVDSICRFKEAGFSNFFFVDNTFNFPPSYARSLCDLMAKRAPGIQWRCILYPWMVGEELVESMARAGCVEVSLGFESGSQKILSAMNKRFRPEEVRGVSGLLKKYGISRMGFLLLGGPGETRQTVEESLEFADSLELEGVKVTTGIRLYPHTALAAAAVAEGVVLPEDDLLYPTFYMARPLEGWIEQTVSGWLERKPNWHS
ncbi:MAG: radical SAM protein [Syntrophobacteraceae bacterium]|nr:radical SAM protein [Syntrophobacteraceae bacterium]